MTTPWHVIGAHDDEENCEWLNRVASLIWRLRMLQEAGLNSAYTNTTPLRLHCFLQTDVLEPGPMYVGACKWVVDVVQVWYCVIDTQPA